ncbi:MAG: RnfABCDGE type electron transport complex subunit D [Candidatus Izemoplasmatales bacterium]|nr:RnfABCDGE type electron transport complex subunit D [Candidatus Izemoplasmatales bacterium]
MARFAGGKAPYLRIADDPSKSTNALMRDFLIGMFPVILFAWYKNGIQVYLEGNIAFLEMLYPLFFIIIGGLSSMLMEGIFFYITNKENRNVKGIMMKLKNSFALIPGIILALLLPLYTPIWVLLFGAFMATIVGKMLFGGFGHNIFNPALLGYLAVGFTLSGVIASAGGVFNQSEVLVDAYAGATPLGTLASSKQISYAALVAPYGSLWNFFLGTIPGALGETGSLAIIIGYLWLSIRKVIKWSTPLIYVGTVFILSWLIGAFAGDGGLWFPTYSILSGGLLFGAVFMATEPVTTPRNPLGKIIFALFLGALTVLFRFIGNFPEGVGTSLIVMNIFTMPIDSISAQIRAGGIRKQSLLKGIMIVLILVAIIVYSLIKSGTIYSLSALLGWFKLGVM